MTSPRIEQRRRARRRHRDRARERSRARDRALAVLVSVLLVRGAIARARRRERAEAADLPRGAVRCVAAGPFDVILGRAEFCFCEGKRYTCPRCLRFVPLCFGAADELGAVCDDCWAQLDGTPAARTWADPTYAGAAA